MPTDKQRRDAQRRKLQRQAERRREQAAKHRRNNLIGSIVGALVVIGLVVFFISETGSDSSSNTQAGASSTPTATPSASASSLSPSASPTASVKAYPCTWTKSGTAARAVTVPPTTTPSRKGTAVVDVATTRGAMTFTLNRAAAPCAVESFVSLAQQKYFDKTPCPRVVSTGIFVLQCGDPTGTGSGGPGYSFDDELTGKEKYTPGVLAMANSGANTNGSQFFIVYKDSPLPPSYTIFGTVTKGLDVVSKVAAGGNDGSNSAGGGKPKLPISLTSVTVAA